MTICWEFYNTPRSKNFCKASLEPSAPDYDFSFNLAVYKKGIYGQVSASANFIPGEQARGLFVMSNPGQTIILFIKDNDGNLKKMLFDVDDYWTKKGDVDYRKTIIDYKKQFEKK